MKYKSKKLAEEIHYTIGECFLGAVLVASSNVGICAIFLGNTAEELKNNLQNRFPFQLLTPKDQQMTSVLSEIIGSINNPSKTNSLVLDERGTSLQLSVWQALRKIPMGKTVSYTEIAKEIGLPRAVRAVANACGANPVAVLTPCHRVVKLDGSLSGYRWGIERKLKLLQLEGLK